MKCEVNIVDENTAIVQRGAFLYDVRSSPHARRGREIWRRQKSGRCVLINSGSVRKDILDAIERKQHKDAFPTQRSLTKDEVLHIEPGTWIELKWEDSPNSMALLLEKPEFQVGDVCLKCFHPEFGTVDSHACHGQVVRVHSKIIVPALTPII